MARSARNSICSHLAPDYGQARYRQYSTPYIKDVLYQLAYAWTLDPLVAGKLVSRVLDDYARFPYQGDRYGLRLYSSLFRRWRIHVISCGKNVPAYHGVEDIKSEVLFMRECIYRLPEHYKIVITLVDIADLSYRDAGLVMNVGIDKINSWITVARKTIIQQMHSYGSHIDQGFPCSLSGLDRIS